MTFWKSSASNVIGLVMFLSSAGGVGALQMLGLSNQTTQIIGGCAMILGALLVTPKEKHTDET